MFRHCGGTAVDSHCASRLGELEPEGGLGSGVRDKYARQRNGPEY